jgi:hypothetical protein
MRTSSVAHTLMNQSERRWHGHGRMFATECVGTNCQLEDVDLDAQAAKPTLVVHTRHGLSIDRLNFDNLVLLSGRLP